MTGEFQHVSTISCPRIWTNTRTHKQSSGVSLAYANGCHDAAKARPHRIHADLSDFNENATSTYVIRRLFALWTWKALPGSDYRDHSSHFSSFLPASWPAKTSWTTKNLRHVGCSSAQAYFSSASHFKDTMMPKIAKKTMGISLILSLNTKTHPRSSTALQPKLRINSGRSP